MKKDQEPKGIDVGIQPKDESLKSETSPEGSVEIFAAGEPAVFVGRDYEQKLFHELLKGKNTNVLHLYGGPGTGKTSLLKQYENYCQKIGMPVSYVNISEKDPATGLPISLENVVKNIFTGWQQSGIEIGDEAIADAAKAYSDWYLSIEDLVQQGSSRSDLILDPEMRDKQAPFRKLLSSVTDKLKLRKSKAVLLMDIDLMDDLEYEKLRSLVDSFPHQAGLFKIATTSETPLHSMASLRKEDKMIHYIEDLGKNDIARMLKASAPAKLLSQQAQSLVKSIFDLSCGNPQFATIAVSVLKEMATTKAGIDYETFHAKAIEAIYNWLHTQILAERLDTAAIDALHWLSMGSPFDAEFSRRTLEWDPRLSLETRNNNYWQIRKGGLLENGYNGEAIDPQVARAVDNYDEIFQPLVFREKHRRALNYFQGMIEGMLFYSPSSCMGYQEEVEEQWAKLGRLKDPMLQSCERLPVSLLRYKLERHRDEKSRTDYCFVTIISDDNNLQFVVGEKITDEDREKMYPGKISYDLLSLYRKNQFGDWYYPIIHIGEDKVGLDQGKQAIESKSSLSIAAAAEAENGRALLTQQMFNQDGYRYTDPFKINTSRQEPIVSVMPDESALPPRIDVVRTIAKFQERFNGEWLKDNREQGFFNFGSIAGYLVPWHDGDD